MASKPAKPAKKAVKRRRQTSGNGGFIPILFICLGGLALFKYEVAMLISAGLLPTIVLAFTGKGESKNEKLQCVSFTNLAGIATMVPDVWDRPSMVYTLLGEPLNLLVMWGAAGFGYALVYVGPMLASMVLQTMAKDRVKNIIQQKQTLVELWGPEVLGDRDEPPAVDPGRKPGFL